MPRYIAALLLLAALCISTTVNATLMPSVYVDGKAWLQPVDFIDYDWNDIAKVCDPLTGACHGSLDENKLTGLTWASLSDISRLYEAVIPGFWPGGINSASYFGNTVIPQFQEFFDMYGFVPTTELNTPLGNVRQMIAYSADSSSIETVFQVTEYFAENIYIAANNGDYQTINSGHKVGAWFFREVPAPATINLATIALAALYLARRCQL